MRLTVDIEGLKEVQQSLQGFSDRRLSAAVATALTRTVRTARQDVQQAMRSRLEAPTPYTLGGVAFKSATAQTLEAEVFLRTDQAEGRGGRPAGVYLRNVVFGGTRRTKAYERLLSRMGVLPSGWATVPGEGVELDQFGNIPRTLLRSIFRDLTKRNAGPQPSSRGRGRAARARIFAVSQSQRGGLPPGIYRQEAGKREVQSLLIFVQRATFQQDLPFFEIVRASVGKSLPGELRRAIDQAASRLQARSGA